MTEVLVLYFSRTHNTAKMAEHIALGIEQTPGVCAKVRTVPNISPNNEATEPSIPEEGPPYATLDDLAHCDGFIIGSPTRFGNMAGALKHFLDTTGGIWQNGDLIGKPAGCFTSTGSAHGGQESTLLSMMLPLMHHGMVIIGTPYSEPVLMRTQSGGTPYGPSHCAGPEGTRPLTDDEKTLCVAFGKRMANFALRLKD